MLKWTTGAQKLSKYNAMMCLDSQFPWYSNVNGHCNSSRVSVLCCISGTVLHPLYKRETRSDEASLATCFWFESMALHPNFQWVQGARGACTDGGTLLLSKVMQMLLLRTRYAKRTAIDTILWSLSYSQALLWIPLLRPKAWIAMADKLTQISIAC